MEIAEVCQEEMFLAAEEILAVHTPELANRKIHAQARCPAQRGNRDGRTKTPQLVPLVRWTSAETQSLGGCDYKVFVGSPAI